MGETRRFRSFPPSPRNGEVQPRTDRHRPRHRVIAPTREQTSSMMTSDADGEAG